MNEVLGMTVVVAAVMLLLALVSYHPNDPSLNTIGSDGAAHVRNWAGRVGASVSDILLQVFGVATLALPLLLARLGVCWVRSRAQGAALAKSVGVALWLAAAPVAFALLPTGWMYKSALPLGGAAGTLLAATLVLLVNTPGAWVCVGLVMAVAVYLSTTFTFNTAQEWATERVSFMGKLREKLAARRHKAEEEDGATRREREFARQQAVEQKQQVARKAAESGSLVASLFAKWGFWRKGIHADDAEPLHIAPVSRTLFSQQPRTDVDAGPEPEFAPLPAHLQQVAEAHLQQQLAANAQAPVQGGFEDWDQPASATAMPVDVEPFAWMEGAALPPAEQAPAHRAEVVPFPTRAELPRPARQTAPAYAAPLPAEPVAAPAAKAISFGKRADENLQPVTMTAKSVHGYKLPPSSLLYRNEEHASIREDALREEAKVLVEKCGEFGVDGQVTQINPGPVVTTFEFRPDAGVKYSRVTGLADDLCLAMAAESILIERMAGKSTVGIQVPNHERETIWLRDVVESDKLCEQQEPARNCHGQGHQRPHRDRGHGEHAACADRRVNRIG